MFSNARRNRAELGRGFPAGADYADCKVPAATHAGANLGTAGSEGRRVRYWRIQGAVGVAVRPAILSLAMPARTGPQGVHSADAACVRWAVR